MRIISYNIGIKIDNSQKVCEYLKAQSADIICLQEAMRPLDFKVHPIYRSEETIRQILGADYPYYFFAPEWVADKHIASAGRRNKDFGGMVEQGKLILSRHLITHGYNYFYNKVYEFDCDRINFHHGDDHGRTLQVCVINIGGQVIQVGNVHGLYSQDKLDTEHTIEQSKFILEKLGAKGLPTILLGDFNLSPETESIALINKRYNNINSAFGISSTRPSGPMIDFIFLSKEFTAKSLTVEEIDASDHYPLILEITNLK
jgi:endonuclease/exonuclease/phosphatase family metal-dependent hydrolase